MFVYVFLCACLFERLYCLCVCLYIGLLVLVFVCLLVYVCLLDCLAVLRLFAILCFALFVCLCFYVFACLFKFGYYSVYVCVFLFVALDAVCRSYIHSLMCVYFSAFPCFLIASQFLLTRMLVCLCFCCFSVRWLSCRLRGL